MNHSFSKPKRESNQLVFGIRAVIEAIKSGQEIESLYLQRGLRGDLMIELKELLTQHQITAQQVPVEKLNRLTMKNHQGVVAFISPIIYQKIEDIIPAIYERCEEHGCHCPDRCLHWCTCHCCAKQGGCTNQSGYHQNLSWCTLHAPGL
jgi:tRNA G18 (ribose-2'-O)-methylase SpoU